MRVWIYWADKLVKTIVSELKYRTCAKGIGVGKDQMHELDRWLFDEPHGNRNGMMSTKQ